MEEKYFIVGKYVGLKAPEEKDLEEWYQWFNDPEITLYTCHGVFPNTLDKEREFWLSKQNNPNTLLLLSFRKKDDKLLGVVSLQNIDWVYRKAEWAQIMGAKESRDLNTTLETAYLIIKHGFESLNLNRIYGGSHEKLASWLELLKRIGFKEEGRLRQEMFTNGRYYDVIRIGILAEDFFKLKPLFSKDGKEKGEFDTKEK